MKGKIDWYNTILISIIVVSLSLLFVQNVSSITGHATEGSTSSNVTISKALAINFSPNLTTGIQFGNVETLPATNVNASHNYDAASSGTGYYIEVSTDSNTDIDFCVKADGDMIAPGDIHLGLGNETYAYYNSTNSTHPDLTSEINFTTNYVKAGEGVSPGESNYYRFWLDVPGAQESGDYNNTVSFKGVVTTLSC